MSRKETVVTAAGSQLVEDTRRATRYSFRTPLSGDIQGEGVQIVNISAGGLGIINDINLKVGSSVTIIAMDPDFSERHKFRAKVMWSRMMKERNESGIHQYRTGLAYDQPVEEIAGTIGRLIRFHAQEDADSFERKKKAVMTRMIERAKAGIQGAQSMDPDTLIVVERAMRQLSESEDAQQILAEARTELEIRGISGSHSREVLILWKMLDCSLDLEKIARARTTIEAMRRNGSDQPG